MFFSATKSDPARIDFTALEKYQTALFAGGCFWCLEPPFDQLAGVKAAVVGYTGGTTEHPTYEQVSSGTTGHYEAIQVYYEPTEVSYAELLETFWRQIDPTDAGGQFYDRGHSYKTAIFYQNDLERKLAESSKQALEAEHRFPGPIVTEILPAKPFYPAEEYHQKYYKKEFMHYKYYKEGSGRDRFIQKIWGSEKSSH